MTPTQPSAPALTDRDRQVNITITLPLQGEDNLSRYPGNDAQTFVRMAQLGAVPPAEAVRIAASHFIQMAMASTDRYDAVDHLHSLDWVTATLSNPATTDTEES